MYTYNKYEKVVSAYEADKALPLIDTMTVMVT